MGSPALTCALPACFSFLFCFFLRAWAKSVPLSSHTCQSHLIVPARHCQL